MRLRQEIDSGCDKSGRGGEIDQTGGRKKRKEVRSLGPMEDRCRATQCLGNAAIKQKKRGRKPGREERQTKPQQRRCRWDDAERAPTHKRARARKKPGRERETIDSTMKDEKEPPKKKYRSNEVEKVQYKKKKKKVPPQGPEGREVFSKSCSRRGEKTTHR